MRYHVRSIYRGYQPIMAKAECDISKPSHLKFWAWALLVALDQVYCGPRAPVGCQAGYLGCCLFVGLLVVFRSDSRSRWSLIVVILLKLQSSLVYSLGCCCSMLSFVCELLSSSLFVCRFLLGFWLSIDCRAFATWARLFLLEILNLVLNLN